METNLTKIKIRDLVDKYNDSGELGVKAYHGRLNVRPEFQREFVYSQERQDAVIRSIMRGLPLGVMYWIDSNNNSYELMDGQQRTISICRFFYGDYCVDFQYFKTLTEEEQNKFLDYELTVYICTGTNREKLDWFKTINVATEPLTEQELRNAIYSCRWLTDAKNHFSKNNCPAQILGKDYLSGSAIRQDYLETVIDWVSNGKIEDYMAHAKSSHRLNASDLWVYFQTVINWVKVLFPNYRREMKGLQWGYLYNIYKHAVYDPAVMEDRIKVLMMDDDVSKKSGIYLYLLTNDEKYLNIRQFTESQKRQVYERQNGICPICGEKFEYEEMEADHIIPWSQGGKTIIENCQLLCKKCNREKSNS